MPSETEGLKSGLLVCLPVEDNDEDGLSLFSVSWAFVSVTVSEFVVVVVAELLLCFRFSFDQVQTPSNGLATSAMAIPTSATTNPRGTKNSGAKQVMMLTWCSMKAMSGSNNAI